MFENILAALDGDARSDGAAQMALRLARLTGGHVTLLHVLEPDAVGGGGEASTFDDGAELDRLLAEHAVAFEQAGVQVSAEVRLAKPGSTATEIVDAAESYEADVIVIGSRSGTSVPPATEDTAHAVLRLASGPVLVVTGDRRPSK